MESIENQTRMAGPEIVAALRDHIVARGKRKSVLANLNDKQLLSLYYNLRSGRANLSNLNRLAYIVQRVWRVGSEMKIESIRQAIWRFKRDAIPLLRQADPEVRKGENRARRKERRKAQRKRAQNIENKLDLMGTWRWAIQRQAERCSDWMTKEEGCLKLMPEVTADIRLLNDMCKDMSKLYMELGIFERQPDEHRIQIVHQWEGMAGKFDKEALANAAGAVMQDVEKYIEILEFDPESEVWSRRPQTERDKAERAQFGICGGIGIKSDELPPDGDL